jgi:hypothetical protein
MRAKALLTDGAKPLAIAAGVVVLLTVVQVGLPIYLESRVEDRLTDDGGTAQVDLDAIPSPRLLLEDGDRLSVRGGGYRLPLVSPEERVFERIDGFDDVDVDVTSFRVGPFGVDRFRLTREGGRDFNMHMDGSVEGRDLAAYAGGELAGELGELFGRIGSELVPGSRQAIPVSLDATLESRDGRPRVKEVDGSVAGVPAGPLAEALAAAIADRL